MAKFTPGKSGNSSGRPRGSKNTSSQLREALRNDLGDIIESVIAAAKDGSHVHQRMILERTLPALKPVDEPIKLRLSGSLTARAQTVVRAVAAGKLTPEQATRFMGLLADESQITKTDQLVERVAAIARQLEMTFDHDH